MMLLLMMMMQRGVRIPKAEHEAGYPAFSRRRCSIGIAMDEPSVVLIGRDNLNEFALVHAYLVLFDGIVAVQATCLFRQLGVGDE